MSPQEIDPAILRATGGVHPLDVTFINEEDLVTPWKQSSTKKGKLPQPLPDSLTITLANLVYFEKTQLPQPLTNRLIRLAAFQNPEFYRAQAMRMSVWDKPRVIGCAENYPHHIGLPRGCLDATRELLRENGIRCETQDERLEGTPIDADFVGTLRPEQEAAVTAILRHDVGVLCAPTAFGKTVVGAALVSRRLVNTLILVHRTELMRQWQERLSTFLGAGKEVVGTIGGGRRKPTGKIDIAVMQSLSRKGEVDPLVKDYGHIIVDECHHVGAVSFDAILKIVKARYVLGLTATPVRRDGQQPIIFMQCGPIRHTAAPPARAPHDLEVVPRLQHKLMRLPDNVGIQDVFRTLADDEERTAAIADDVQRATADSRKVLILTERTNHLDNIRGALEGHGAKPFVLHGRMSKKQRAILLAELNALPPDAPWVLLATGKLVGEGFTRHTDLGHAGIVEGHTATIRRPAASGACLKNRRSDNRFRRHWASSVAADVGDAPARISSNGLPDSRTLDLISYATCKYLSDAIGFPGAPPYSHVLLGKHLTDESYRELQRALMENPELGDVMPGTGGIRKVRWEGARRGKGIYYCLTADHQIWFFTLYDRYEAVDLTADEKKVSKNAIQAELEARRRKP